MAYPKLSLKTLAVQYAGAAALLWLFFRHPDWGALRDGLTTVHWGLLACAVALRMLALAAASRRWQLLLDPVSALPLRPIAAATMMGMTVSALVSMQAAEVFRPYILSRRRGLDLGATLATVTVEWLLDVIGILVVVMPAVWGARWLGVQTIPVGMSMTALTSLLMAALVILVAVRFLSAQSEQVERWIRQGSPGLLRRTVAHQFGVFALGLQVLERPWGTTEVLGYSAVIAVITAFSCLAALSAFGLHVPVLSCALILGLITVGGMVPTPGAVGGFHAICQLGLVALFGFDRAQTILPVLGLHAVLYLPPAAVGAACFFAARRDLLWTLA